VKNAHKIPLTDGWDGNLIRLWRHHATRHTLHHRSIYKYLDTGLLSISLAIGDPFKLTSPAQHAWRWRMRGSQTCRLLHRPRGLARMRHCENRPDREFMLGNSRMKLPDAMHAG